MLSFISLGNRVFITYLASNCSCPTKNFGIVFLNLVETLLFSDLIKVDDELL